MNVKDAIEELEILKEPIYKPGQIVYLILGGDSIVGTSIQSSVTSRYGTVYRLSDGSCVDEIDIFSDFQSAVLRAKLYCWQPAGYF